MNFTLRDRDGRDLARLELTPTGVHLELVEPGPADSPAVASGLRALADLINRRDRPGAPANNPSGPAYLSPKEAAARFGVSSRWLREHCEHLAVKIGHRLVRYQAPGLERFFLNKKKGRR